MLLYSNEYLNTWRVLSSRFFGRFRAISFSARGTDRLGYVRPLEVVERDYILAVVAANGGNRVRAAGLDHRPTCGEHDYFLGGALSPGRRSPVSRSTERSGRINVGSGFIAARTTTGSPLLTPASRPPARFVARRRFASISS